MKLKLVHLILLEDDRVLLLKRQNTGAFDGLYSLPSRKCEIHETLEEAGIREAKEELGITLSPKHIMLLHQSVTPSLSHPEINYLNSFLEISAYQGNIKNVEPHKCAELKFYALSKLPTNMIPFARKGLEKSLKAKALLTPKL